MHCTKISAEFKFGIIAPWVRTPKKLALGYEFYDVGKISAGCLIHNSVHFLCQVNVNQFCHSPSSPKQALTFGHKTLC